MSNDQTHTRFQLQQKKAVLQQRQQILHAVHRYFQTAGFLEVATPLRVKAPAPELNIDTEPSGDHFLIASPELHMKRLIAAEYEKIYQITKCFRQGERGQRHLPEFTMLEWYETGATMETLERRCMEVVVAAARSNEVFPSLHFNGIHITLAEGAHRMEVQDAFERFAGWRPGANPDPVQFDMDLVDKVEPSLPTDKPLFLVGYPANMASLARMDSKNNERALRLEMYVGGIELANGFEELTDVAIQRRRFVQEEEQRRKLGKPPYPMDEEFLSALTIGMPPCAGMAMGLDRLVMLLTNRTNISDVVAFM